MKSKIPVALLEIVQPIVDENSMLINSFKNSDVLYDIRDQTNDSDYFYQILNQENSNGHLGYVVEYKPRNKYESTKFKTWLRLDHVSSSITEWISVIEAHQKIRTVYDDPILKSNKDRFEKEFKILDPDADFISFDLDQQLFLNQYINNVKEKIVKLISESAPSKVEELNILHSEAIEIQDGLTTESKNAIIKKLSGLWGRAQKIGLEVIKEVFVDLISEITKKLLTGG